MASTSSLVPFSRPGTGDVMCLTTSSISGLSILSHRSLAWTGHSCLGNARVFIILSRHRTLALHWSMYSSLEPGHMLESTYAFLQMVVGIQLRSSDLRYPLWSPTSTSHLLRCCITCIGNVDISGVSLGIWPGLSCANWLSINILLFRCPLVSMLKDAQSLDAQGSRALGITDSLSCWWTFFFTTGTIFKKHLPSGLDQTNSMHACCILLGDIYVPTSLKQMNLKFCPESHGQR